MGNEYQDAVRQIERERYAICEINGTFALLGIVSWLGSSYLALAALAMILVLNLSFPLEYRRRLRNAKRTRKGRDVAVASIAYERYMICVVNGIFAMLGIVSWWGLAWLALVALVLLSVLNLTFPFQHRRRLLEAKQKQIAYRLTAKPSLAHRAGPILRPQVGDLISGEGFAFPAPSQNAHPDEMALIAHRFLITTEEEPRQNSLLNPGFRLDTA